MTSSFCCDEFKRAVEVDNIYIYYEDENKWDINCYEVDNSYYMNFCPYCGKDLCEKTHYDEKN